MNEKPPIINERLRRADAAKTLRRMGYLRLFTYGSTAGMAGYFLFLHEFKDPITGQPYEHVFSPLRRLFWRQADRVLGVRTEEDGLDGANERPTVDEPTPQNSRLVTPAELKQMRDSGMSRDEILMRASTRYELSKSEMGPGRK
jgi:hypothetical protein